MRIFAFTDTHGSPNALERVKRRIKRYKPDVVVCAGDFTIFGNNQRIILKMIDSFGVRTLLIHGNHEIEGEVKEDCKDMKNIEFIHKKVVEIGGYLFIGYGGGGFSLVDKGFERFYKGIMSKKEKILITHGPPYGTIIDRIMEEHCGNKSYMKFINEKKPIIAISGHLHENNGKKQMHKKTYIINPGPYGELIDVEEIKKSLK